ncbi:hypothetical protein HOT99_gp030 [Caulobacter phage CcrBL10]|uniref:Uncharacterized protein n=1 Tax=Caulobacter phage CcrBL10 TaxID=2283269 RepID=A0A385E8T3_9CAUD|nr:hypothetical protein HOT99_gp030 [Caulobacter phage CcrBL10]AXQ68234.1 hypothetical protein CcrBL10_gp030 [Caulobacter phage CcrBL10]
MTDQPIDPLDRAILDLLQEEGGEVLIEMIASIGRLIKVASKVKRFGDGKNPFEKDPKSNFELLQDEVGDFEALVDILIERGVLTREGIDARKAWKRGMLREHKTLPDAAFLPPVSVPSPLDDFPPGNPIVQAAKAARNGGYVALFGGHAPSAEPPGKALYTRYCDSQGIHSNRFPGWSELPANVQKMWDEAAEAEQVRS